MKKLIVILSVIVFFTSCEKENKLTSYTYSSRVLASELPPVMGGCIGNDNEYKIFNLPLVEGGQFSNILLTAKINSISNKGILNTFYEFNSTFSSGVWTTTTISNIYGWIPMDVKVDLAMRKNGEILMSYNRGSYLYYISEAGMFEILAKNGITSIATNSKDETFFIVSPIYSQDDLTHMLTPPVIYKLDSLNRISEYFTFSSNLSFRYSGLHGPYPSDIAIDLSFDSNDDLYICFGYDNIIYKINDNKELSIYRDDIYCPVSIAFNIHNAAFVVSGAKFKKTSEDKYIMDKAMEVYKLTSKESKLIYKGGNIEGKGFLQDLTKDFYMNKGTHYNISINEMNDIFLADPAQAKVILIK